MSEAQLIPCRKCGAPNPAANEYCRTCGATLLVSTSAIKAQPKPTVPMDKRLRWRLIVLGALVILGIMAFLFGAFLFIASTMINEKTHVRDLGALIDEYFGLIMAGAASFLLSFGVGGMFITWLANRRTVLEPAIAACTVLVLLGLVGWTVTDDAPFVAAVLALPASALAAIGGRLGEMLPRGEGKK